MGGGQFSIIRDPWRYHSAFAGLLHPHETMGSRLAASNTQPIEQFHQHFTYINNERNENHKVQNLMRRSHEAEKAHDEHHYEEYHDHHNKHHGEEQDIHHHEHHDDDDHDRHHHGNEDHHHSNEGHHHSNEENEDHHRYAEHYEKNSDEEHHKRSGDNVRESGDRKIWPGSDIAVEKELGTPPRDNMREDRVPKSSTNAITPAAAKISSNDYTSSGDTEAQKRDALGLSDTPWSLEEPNYDKDIIKTVSFGKLEKSDDDFSSGDSEEKNNVTVDAKKETSSESLQNIQQYHARGPANQEPLVTRELGEPLLPIVVIKRDLNENHVADKKDDENISKYNTRNHLIRNAFFGKL